MLPQNSSHLLHYLVPTENKSKCDHRFTSPLPFPLRPPSVDSLFQRRTPTSVLSTDLFVGLPPQVSVVKGLMYEGIRYETRPLTPVPVGYSAPCRDPFLSFTEGLKSVLVPCYSRMRIRFHRNTLNLGPRGRRLWNGSGRFFSRLCTYYTPLILHSWWGLNTSRVVRDGVCRQDPLCYGHLFVTLPPPNLRTPIPSILSVYFRSDCVILQFLWIVLFLVGFVTNDWEGRKNRTL